MQLALSEIQDILDTIRYKDFNFFVQPEDKNCFSICYRAKDKDNFNPHRVVDLGGRHTFYYWDTLFESKQRIIDVVWKLVREYEIHEAGEKFYVNGELPHDPHKVDKIA